MGFSHDMYPYVGPCEEPGKWIIGGFHGHGMTRIWLSAKALVEQLLASEDGEMTTAWPDWMPRAYVNRSGRCDADELKEYLSSL